MKIFDEIFKANKYISLKNNKEPSYSSIFVKRETKEDTPVNNNLKEQLNKELQNETVSKVEDSSVINILKSANEISYCVQRDARRYSEGFYNGSGVI